MDKAINKIRLEQWEKLIVEANTCGMLKKEWCHLHGITERKLYYWQKKVREAALADHGREESCSDLAVAKNNQTGFIELKTPVMPASIIEEGIHERSAVRSAKPGCVVLQYGSFQLSVDDPCAEETLRMVMKVLQDA